MKDPKKLFKIVGFLALAASVIMYAVGSDSSHLSELKDFFWSPLILAVVCFAAAQKK